MVERRIGTIAGIITILIATVAPCVASAQQATLPADTTNDERVRLRGGFSLGGGFIVGATSGGLVHLTGRLGIQFSRAFGVYYQNMPMLSYSLSRSTFDVGVTNFNSVLANLTLFDVIDLAVGPSFDLVARFGCDANSLACATGQSTSLGLHGRASVNIGGRMPQSGRRIGFAIGLDAHPIFLPSGVAFVMAVNLGVEAF